MKSIKYALFFVVLTFSILGIAWALGFANSTSAIETGARVIAVIFAIALSFAAIEIFVGFRKTESGDRKSNLDANSPATSHPNETDSGPKGPQF